MELNGVQIIVCQDDLPRGVGGSEAVAIDTETMGLNPLRDRLCLVQVFTMDGRCYLVRLYKDYEAPNLRSLLEDRSVTKIFHFARFDLGVLKRSLRTECGPIYCTKIASRLVRTYTDRHGLKGLCKDLLGVDISKQQQSSDWGTERPLTEDQIKYAASDVLYLHRLRERLDLMLERERRVDLARECFDFLPTLVELDSLGWPFSDIFDH